MISLKVTCGEIDFIIYLFFVVMNKKKINHGYYITQIINGL